MKNTKNQNKSCQGKDINTQVHLATTRHLRCREELSLRCNLDVDSSGVSGGETARYPSATPLAYLAQPVEQWIEAPCVGGSIPSVGIR